VQAKSRPKETAVARPIPPAAPVTIPALPATIPAIVAVLSLAAGLLPGGE
jgi:hypothetical protein